MKVLQVYPSLFGGGAQSVVNSLNFALNRLPNVESQVASIDKSSSLKLNRSVLGIYNAFRMYSFVSRNNINVIHFHGGITLGVIFPILLILIIKIKKIKLCFTSHNYAVVCPSQKRYSFNIHKVCNACCDSKSLKSYFRSRCEASSLVKKTAKSIYFFSLKFMVERLGEVIVPSEHSSKVLGRYLSINIKVLHNPISTPINVYKKHSELRDGICYLGRFSKEKGLDKYLDAIKERTTLYENKQLHFIGSGIMEPFIKREVAKLGLNVKFHGMKDRQGVDEILQCCKVVVVPSLWEETFGLVAGEAVLNGCIPVVSNMGALKDTVSESNVGYIFDIKSLNDLNNKVHAAFSNYDNYDWEACISSYKEVVSEDIYGNENKKNYLSQY